MRDALALTPAGGTVDFAVTGTITLTRGELKLYRSLTVNGPGRASLTIDAARASRVAFVNNTAATVTVLLRGLTLKNGSVTGDGGGILSVGQKLTIDDCEITGCKCTGNGGAVCYGGGSLLMTSTAAFDNVAQQGGGAVFVANGPCELRDLFARGNSAGTGGGAVNSDAAGVLTVTRGAFSNNKSLADNGGAICSLGTFALTGSLFFTNSGAGEGGAIFIAGDAQARITQALFRNNVTKKRGGGVCSAHNDLRIEGCRFQLNSSPIAGGAVYLAGLKSALSGNTMSENKAYQGGAIAIQDRPNLTVSILSSGFFSNTAAQGGAILNAATLEVFANFNGNKASQFGGAIASVYGGATSAQPGTLTILGGDFSNNGPQGTAQIDGGAIWSRGNTRIVDATFTGNTANQGGAIGAAGGASRLSLTRTTLTSNNAARGGGLDNQLGSVASLVASQATGNGTPETLGADAYNAGTLILDAASTVPNIDGPGVVVKP